VVVVEVARFVSSNRFSTILALSGSSQSYFVGSLGVGDGTTVHKFSSKNRPAPLEGAKFRRNFFPGKEAKLREKSRNAG
jgi:hypothetical protein